MPERTPARNLVKTYNFEVDFGIVLRVIVIRRYRTSSSIRNIIKKKIYRAEFNINCADCTNRTNPTEFVLKF